MITISALTGQRVEKILPLVMRADEARNRRIPTSQLNDFFERAIAQPRGGTAPAPAKGGVSRLARSVFDAGRRAAADVCGFHTGGKAWIALFV